LRFLILELFGYSLGLGLYPPLFVFPFFHREPPIHALSLTPKPISDLLIAKEFFVKMKYPSVPEGTEFTFYVSTFDSPSLPSNDSFTPPPSLGILDVFPPPIMFNFFLVRGLFPPSFLLMHRSAQRYLRTTPDKHSLQSWRGGFSCADWIVWAPPPARMITKDLSPLVVFKLTASHHGPVRVWPLPPFFAAMSTNWGPRRRAFSRGRQTV